MSEMPVRVAVLGMKVALIAPSRPASAISISISISMYASGGKPVARMERSAIRDRSIHLHQDPRISLRFIRATLATSAGSRRIRPPDAPGDLRALLPLDRTDLVLTLQT